MSTPIDIQAKGLLLAARHNLQLEVDDLLTGERVTEVTLHGDERITLPQVSGALLILGEVGSPSRKNAR